MAVGECLGDGATHGVADDRHHPDSEAIEDSGHVVGNVVDLESVPGHRGQAVAPMVDHDHPVFLGQRRADPVPLCQ